MKKKNAGGVPCEMVVESRALYSQQSIMRVRIFPKDRLTRARRDFLLHKKKNDERKALRVGQAHNARMAFSIISLFGHKKKRKCEEHMLEHSVAKRVTHRRRALLLHFEHKSCRGSA